MNAQPLLWSGRAARTPASLMVSVTARAALTARKSVDSPAVRTRAGRTRSGGGRHPSGLHRARSCLAGPVRRWKPQASHRAHRRTTPAARTDSREQIGCKPAPALGTSHADTKWTPRQSVRSVLVHPRVALDRSRTSLRSHSVNSPDAVRLCSLERVPAAVVEGGAASADAASNALSDIARAVCFALRSEEEIVVHRCAAG